MWPSPQYFGNSYTVPIPKGDYIHGRELKVDNFWGISMSNNFNAFDNITAIESIVIIV